MQQREAELADGSISGIRAQMAESLMIMRDGIEKGLHDNSKSLGGLVGGGAGKMDAYAKQKPLSGERTAKAVARAIAVAEMNARMGKIVAAPTGGASGILPGALVSVAQDIGKGDEAIIDALFTAAAIGYLINRNATVSGAGGGCQAETGTAASMAAAGLVELMGGSPAQALTAAGVALKNVLGLVCDPVAGLVEVPCVKRNAIGTANALISADMALAGIESLLPFDEIVDAMLSVGRAMSSDLRETARGGLAATPTAKRIAESM
jgi:L-serine dehydratase